MFANSDRIADDLLLTPARFK